MNNIKCPFCQRELEIIDLDVQLLGCENQNCKHSIHDDTAGTKELWQELILIQRALEVAVKRLSYIKNNYKSWTPDRDAQMIAQAANGLDEIKSVLEQRK